MTENISPETPAEPPAARERLLQWIVMAVLVISLGSCAVFLIEMYDYASLDYVDVAQKGESLVKAVEFYHDDRGEWPPDLDALQLDEVQGIDLQDWSFDIEAGLLVYTYPDGRDSAGTRVVYRFGGAREGWFVLGDFSDRRIETTRPDEVID